MRGLEKFEVSLTPVLVILSFFGDKGRKKGFSLLVQIHPRITPALNKPLSKTEGGKRWFPHNSTAFPAEDK